MDADDDLLEYEEGYPVGDEAAAAANVTEIRIKLVAQATAGPIQREVTLYSSVRPRNILGF